jgi:hypothetical protein
LYRLPEHGWLIAVFRELRKLCEQCQDADDRELIGMLENVAGTIEAGDARLPETKKRLRNKLLEQYRANIR